MEKFDYKLCMERDGGYATCGGTKVELMNTGYHHNGELLFPVKIGGSVWIARQNDLRNLAPPKPELKPVDVVWWGSGQGEPAAVAVRSGQTVAAELRRITVDPNAMTADELAEHGIETLYSPLNKNWSWGPPGEDLRKTHPTESAARLAATEWLRKEGKIK